MRNECCEVLNRDMKREGVMDSSLVVMMMMIMMMMMMMMNVSEMR